MPGLELIRYFGSISNLTADSNPVYRSHEPSLVIAMILIVVVPKQEGIPLGRSAIR